MELIYGAEHSTNPGRNLRQVEGLVACLDVLAYDQLAAMHSGQLRAELAAIGQSIGPYDQMTAGHCRSVGLIMVTNNVEEFERIPELRVNNWVGV